MTTQRENLLRTARQASANYADAKRALAEARACMRLGMTVPDIGFIESREYVLYHAWKRATANLIA